MRILITIPHYFAADQAATGAPHGSERPEPKKRVRALTACIAALHQAFGQPQCMLNIARREAEPANTGIGTTELDVLVCTTGHFHLLHDLPLARNSFEHVATEAPPRLLGFECHRVLRERSGSYDYYGFMEDDLIVHDAWLFTKLNWFNAHAGDHRLLQPNRFELGSTSDLVRKIYIDGDLLPQVVEPFRRTDADPPLDSRLIGVDVRFRPARNPHAGCFFLNDRQLRHWIDQPWFLDRDTSFIGPLESAATLGVLRSFAIYKPARENAAFLEIEHYGQAFLRLLRRG